MNSLTKRLAFFFARRKFFRDKDAVVNFNKFITTSRRYLIILPERQIDIHSAVDVINHFLLNQKEVTILCRDSVNPNIPAGVKKVTYTENDISRLNLPRKEFIHKLRSYVYDVIIDLNLEDNFFSSLLAKAADGKFVIGFKKENSDEFYNFQVANNQNNAEISYRNLLNSLSMF